MKPHDTCGYWTLLYPGRRQTKAIWLCRCRCLCIREVLEDSLRRRNSQSCGCRKEHPIIYTSPSEKKLRPEYRVWKGIKTRCYNPRARYYADYGGRGIAMCPQWRDSFESFLAAVGTRPSEHHSLDRYPDNNGNYEPGNVRWATMTEQSRNRRDTRWLTYQGETRCLPDWSDRLGLPSELIENRLRRRWTVERALSTPAIPPSAARSHVSHGGKSGYLGVTFKKGYQRPWCAQIMILGRQHYLGLFSSPEEASQAYMKAVQRHETGNL